MVRFPLASERGLSRSVPSVRIRRTGSGGGPGDDNDPQAALGDLPATTKKVRAALTSVVWSSSPRTGSEIWAESMQVKGSIHGFIKSLVPTPVAEDASDLDRFRAFQQWLEQGGPRFEVWAHDSALNGRNERYRLCCFRRSCQSTLNELNRSAMTSESYFQLCRFRFCRGIKRKRLKAITFKQKRRSRTRLVQPVGNLADPLIMRMWSSWMLRLRGCAFG